MVTFGPVVIAAWGGGGSGREKFAGKISPLRKMGKFFAACDQQLHCEFRYR